MDIQKTLESLAKKIPDPSKGLSEELFLLISRLTPMMNVDLLIKDEKGRTLLSWRDDGFVPPGWHIPGGIIRFKETMEDRIRKVAETEIGTAVEFDSIPIAINQIIDEKLPARGHFISILYKCFLPSTFVPKNVGLSSKDQGYLMWHNSCPTDLISHHDIYRKFM